MLCDYGDQSLVLLVSGGARAAADALTGLALGVHLEVQLYETVVAVTILGYASFNFGSLLLPVEQALADTAGLRVVAESALLS